MPELDPIFISVKEAARILSMSTWAVYQKLDQQIIESVYDGPRKRLVNYQSVKDYAASLSAVRPEPEEQSA